MDFTHLAEERYSCRLFSNKKVPDCLIEKIIEVANLSPTAVNKQPFKIFWMKSEKAKQVIRKVTRFTFGADTFLLVGFKIQKVGFVPSMPIILQKLMQVL